MWGFFVCIIVIGLISVFRLVWTQHIADHWSDVQAEREAEIDAVCRGEFGTRAHGLLQIAVSIADDTTLFQNLFHNDPVAVRSAFDMLNGKRTSTNLTFDITDARGAILCWAGKSVDTSYEDELLATPSDTLVSLSQSGLYTYLTVGVSAARKRAYVFVSRPLVVNYPISNRFVRHISFTDDLASMVKTDFRLTTKTEAPPLDSGDLRLIVLTNFSGIPVGRILYTKPQLDAVQQEFNVELDRWLGIFVGLATIGLGWAAIVRIGGIKKKWLKLCALIVGLWGVRFLWIAAEFPARIIGGDLFNPSIYSSPFAFGVASSLGETLITMMIFVVTSALCIRALYVRLVNKPDVFSSVVGSAGTVRSGLILILTVAVLWCTRGYGAAIRSFVMDSMLAYHDPLTTLPSTMVFIMQLNILMLSVCFVAVVLLLSSFIARISDTFMQSDRKVGQLVSPVLLFVAVVGFQAFSFQPIVPWYYSLIILLGGLGVAERVNTSGYAAAYERVVSWKGLIVLIVASSIVSLAITDDQIHKKEREQVQSYAEELLRPLDSWISFVLTDGLRSIGNSIQDEHLARGFGGDSEQNLAFSFWTKTLMSREGYNSAVVVYDDQNKEISRFSVGLNAYEQREVLSKVFENEEESVVVLDRTGPTGASKSYGLWSTIRNEQGVFIGSIALVLSASERSMFGGEENEALRSGQSTILQNVYRPTTVSIFENGRLAATTHEELAAENTVPQVVVDAFSASRESFFWLNETIEGQPYESLFARNPSARGKIVEVRLQSIDYRWHIFNFVKLLSATLSLLAFVMLLLVANSVRTQKTVRFTFRSKLLVSFLVLGFVPLVLLSYYNRKFTAETFSEEMKKTLARDLDLISQRILSAVTDEADYQKGINNDFAESISSDLGVDFTVYRRSRVQANSRPELYEASILDSRLSGKVFADVVLLGKQFVVDDETIGSVRYAVGYKPLYLQDNLVGVIAVPAPYRQRDIEEDLARRNAYYVAVYAIIIIIMMVAGWGVAQQLSTPVRELTLAAMDVGRGNFDVHVRQRSADEIGELVKSFDQMVEEIKTSRINLAAAERKLAWTEMAKQVAHEIKNPLTPMKLSIQHLRQAFKDKARDLPGIVERTTQIIIEQIDALSRIAAEFSHYARMPEKRFERVSLDETILECVELFNNIKGIEFRVKFDDNKAQLIADKDELRRVFINIIRNSVQAMEKGATISIESRRVDSSCVVRFRDSGEGIPENLLSKVFEPNFSTKTDGTGLGLAISQKIIQDLNGTIRISSAPGKGTTVEIVLPV